MAHPNLLKLKNGKPQGLEAGDFVDAALVGNGSVSDTEYNYLDGVTSAIQTQINALSSNLLANVSLVW